MIGSQMVELHNEQVAYFSQKGSIAPDGPSVLGKQLNDVSLSRFIFIFFSSIRAFYLDQSNMPAGSAPKAALIDKVRIALQHVDDITDDATKCVRTQRVPVVMFYNTYASLCQTSYLSREALKHNVHFVKPSLL